MDMFTDLMTISSWLNLPWQGLKAHAKKQKCDKISETKTLTPKEVLCKSYPDLFIREGYQFGYVFDWTILKYPQIGASSREDVLVLLEL
ncbi:hypothetical protein K7X08_021425 [Anisodus acutangulus]|uniref:Uncharacterized protein n=1 Tax=Anisodus acutangulus TaxID=402998 RepID=A0A9Q1M3E3_9SOLA|nr:hypothetical protein K7X08_021425 [Anisodus acutangulus]